MACTARYRCVLDRIYKCRDALEKLSDDPIHDVDRHILQKSLAFYSELRREVEQRWGFGVAQRKPIKGQMPRVPNLTKAERAKREMLAAKPLFEWDVNNWS